MSALPFEIPPFNPGKHAPRPRFDWWGWNPNYPYWSRSCWGGDTEEEARAFTNRQERSVYAIALVKQDGDVFTVLEQFGPDDVSAWERIASSRVKEVAK